MTQIPKTNEVYRHFKGNLYRVLTMAEDSETREPMVVYQALYGDYQVYVRSLAMFMDKVDRKKYPDAEQEERFRRIPSAMEELRTIPEEAFPAPKDQRAAKEALSTPKDQEAAKEPHTPLEERKRPQKQEQPKPEENSRELDPLLLRFLDAQSYREKMDALMAMYDTITDSMINTMAVSLDLEIGDGKLEDRYESLKRCLMTYARYENNRLR